MYRVGASGGRSSALWLMGCLAGGNWKAGMMDSGERSMVMNDMLLQRLMAWYCLTKGEGEREMTLHALSSCGISSPSLLYQYRTTTRGF